MTWREQSFLLAFSVLACSTACGVGPTLYVGDAPQQDAAFDADMPELDASSAQDAATGPDAGATADGGRDGEGDGDRDEEEIGEEGGGISCSEHSHCADNIERSWCDPVGLTCVECLSNEHCPSNESCNLTEHGCDGE